MRRGKFKSSAILTQTAATVSSGGQGMSLTNLSDFPPGGYLYREPSLNWENPEPLQGLDHAVQLLQMVRAQNPASNLNPSYNACLDAIKTYTCHRLNYDPRWCGLPPKEMQLINQQQFRKTRGCAGCRR